MEMKKPLYGRYKISEENFTQIEEIKEWYLEWVLKRIYLTKPRKKTFNEWRQAMINYYLAKELPKRKDIKIIKRYNCYGAVNCNDESQDNKQCDFCKEIETKGQDYVNSKLD